MVARSIAGLSLVLLLASVSSADTVALKNGLSVKGLILNEYKDRIVVSTVDGEKYFMKSDIRSASYDSEARSLLQKGRNQVKKRQYVKAYYTYKKVLEMDPEIEEARKRVGFLKRFLENKALSDITSNIAKRNGFVNGKNARTPAQEVADRLGLVLEAGEKHVYIAGIVDKDAAGLKAGLKEGDRIVSIWGEMTAYMDVDEVAGLLSGPYESNFIAERTVVVGMDQSNPGLFKNHKNIMGAGLELKREGVRVADVYPRGPFEKAGIEVGDLLCGINGEDVKYMPMSRIYSVFRNNQDKDIECVIRRDITVWNGGKGA